MPRPQQSKMSPVQRRQLWFAEPLHDSQDRRIDEANVRVVETVAKRADARVVRRLKIDHAVGASLDIVEQRHKDPGWSREWIQ